jgi:hypothetical protein
VASRLKVSVSAVRPEVGIGELIAARVSVAGGGGRRVRQCWVELRAQIWDGGTRKQAMFTGNVSGMTDVPAPRTGVLSRAEVAGLAGTMLPETGITRELTLPTAALAPSGKTKNVAVDYLLAARIELDSGRKAEGSAPVTLVSRRNTYQGVEGTEYFRRARWCDLELELPAPHARLGESIEGLLRVRPREPVNARMVLRYLYWVQRGRGLPGWAESAAAQTPILLRSLEYFPPTDTYNNFALLTRRRRAARRAALARSVMLSGPAEFAFRIPVRPDTSPTLITPDCSVRYYVCGEIWYARPWNGRDVLAREVNIHSG